MAGKKAGPQNREIRRSLNQRILRSTILNILAVVIVCCVIMAVSMQSLANNILLDSLQPMVRQAAKTSEANMHMLADRMMALSADPRMVASVKDSTTAVREARGEILTEAAETYELYTIALYSLEGRLVQGTDGSPERPDSGFFTLLQETDNLTIHSSTRFQEGLGITVGMPVKDRETGETTLYLIGVYKYDMLHDVISGINLGKNGMAYMVNRDGVVTGHPDQTLVRRGSTLDQLNGGYQEALSRITTGEIGALEFSVKGETMLVAFSPVRGTQWSLVIQVPKADYNPMINAAILFSVLATLVVLIISILLVLRLSRSISRPVKEATQRIVSLSAGDLHTEIVTVQSGDELQVLTQTLGATVTNLNRYLSDIQQVLTQVAQGNLRTAPQVEYQGDFTLIRASLHTILQSMNETLLGFRDAAIRLASMSEELNGQSVQLHQASEEQNASTEALVQDVSSVKEHLSNVTQSSGQTQAKTLEIAQCIQEANNRMSALSSAMDNISANAQEITKIAKAIEDISFQTNILAINASVEAARAGSAGKGFSVVADEVRQLAARSAEAAQSATDMVHSTRTIIQTGVSLTADTAGSLQSISSVSQQINDISQRLVEAVQGQESALRLMEERIGTISDIADRNLHSAGNTEQASGLLSREAEALQTQVEKFVLREGTK